MAILVSKAQWCKLGVLCAHLIAVTVWWKHEACHDGGESVSLNSPGLGAFSPDTTEHFDRWAAATGMLSFALPTWVPIANQKSVGVSVVFLAVAGWALFHTGATSLAGITCVPHDADGPMIAYGPGLFAAYAAAVFVAAHIALQ